MSKVLPMATEIFSAEAGEPKAVYSAKRVAKWYCLSLENVIGDVTTVLFQIIVVNRLICLPMKEGVIHGMQ